MNNIEQNEIICKCCGATFQNNFEVCPKCGTSTNPDFQPEDNVPPVLYGPPPSDKNFFRSEDSVLAARSNNKIRIFFALIIIALSACAGFWLLPFGNMLVYNYTVSSTVEFYDIINSAYHLSLAAPILVLVTAVACFGICLSKLKTKTKIQINASLALLFAAVLTIVCLSCHNDVAGDEFMIFMIESSPELYGVSLFPTDKILAFSAIALISCLSLTAVFVKKQKIFLPLIVALAAIGALFALLFVLMSFVHIGYYSAVFLASVFVIALVAIIALLAFLKYKKSV